jgi:hypothetical protein
MKRRVSRQMRDLTTIAKSLLPKSFKSLVFFVGIVEKGCPARHRATKKV